MIVNTAFFYMRLLVLQCTCLLFVTLTSPDGLAEAAPQKGESALLQAPQACLQYAEFRQERILEGLSRPLVTRGRIVLDCERGTVWSTRTPIVETLVYAFSGEHWLVNGDGEAQQIKNPAQKRIGDILARIVRGDQEFVDQYFQREVVGQTTRLLPTQKRLKRYIEAITLDEISDGFRVAVARTDKQNIKMEIYALRPLAQLDAQSCRTLLETDAGCLQLFAAEE